MGDVANQQRALVCVSVCVCVCVCMSMCRCPSYYLLSLYLHFDQNKTRVIVFLFCFGCGFGFGVFWFGSGSGFGFGFGFGFGNEKEMISRTFLGFASRAIVHSYLVFLCTVRVKCCWFDYWRVLFLVYQCLFLSCRFGYHFVFGLVAWLHVLNVLRLLYWIRLQLSRPEFNGHEFNEL